MRTSEVGVFIRKLRKEKRMSQTDLAEKLFLSRQAISRWENGHNIPDSSTLVLLGEVFDVSTDELLLGRRLSSEERVDEVSKLALTMVDQAHKKNKIIKRLVLIIGVLLIVFLGYYFINSYNSIKVYTMSGESEHFFMNNGIFVTTKGKIYFRVGNLQSNDDIKIKEITLFYKDNDEEVFIFKSDSFDILLVDHYGYDIYFDSKKMKTIAKNLYLKISYNDTSEEMKIELEKDFANNFLFFKKHRKSSIPITYYNGENVSNNENIFDVPTQKMNCELEICTLEINENQKEIFFSYFRKQQLLKIEELENESITVWFYYENNNVLEYKTYLQYDELESFTVFLNNQNNYSEEERKMIKDFQENYLLKYLY